MKLRLHSINGFAQFYYPSKRRPRAFSCAYQIWALPSSIECRPSSYYREPCLPAGSKMYSSNGPSHQPQPKSEGEESQQRRKRKTSRSPSSRNSLRKVVIEAQRSRDESLRKPAASDTQITTKVRTYAIEERVYAD